MMGPRSKNIVVFGKGALAIAITKYLMTYRENIVGIVPVLPEPKWTSSFSMFAQEHGVRILKYEELSEGDFNFGISVYYDKIFKKFFGAGRRLINVHNGPLPRYRGMNPINWALKNREKEHGVTIHNINGTGIDDGPIIAQSNFSIYPDIDEVIDVYERCLQHAYVLFKSVWPKIDKIITRPQNEIRATYFSKKEEKFLDERGGFHRSLSQPYFVGVEKVCGLS